jgi:hypothetical protein
MEDNKKSKDWTGFVFGKDWYKMWPEYALTEDVTKLKKIQDNGEQID